MNALWKTLGSMKLFCILAFAIAAWFFTALMAFPRYQSVFDAMDRQVLLQWFLDAGPGTGPVRAWLCGLVVLVFLLALNLGVCIVEDARAVGRARRAASPRLVLSRVGVLVVHAAYLVVILAHLTTAVSGFRFSAPADPGAVIARSDLPFTVKCHRAKIKKNKKGRLMANMRVTLNPGAADQESFMLAAGRTVWRRGVMIDAEAVQTSRGPRPMLRFTRNYGLWLDAAGIILFLTGMTLRLAFRRNGAHSPDKEA